MDLSIRKRIIKSGANRTLMLVVEAGTPGLPIECAQLIVSGCALAAFIYCLGLQHCMAIVGCWFFNRFVTRVQPSWGGHSGTPKAVRPREPGGFRPVRPKGRGW